MRIAAKITTVRTVGGEASTAFMTVRNARQRARRKRLSGVVVFRRPRGFRRRGCVEVRRLSLVDIGYYNRKRGGGSLVGPRCSRNPHDEAVVVRRAQSGTSPGHPRGEKTSKLGRNIYMRVVKDSLAASFRVK